ncbi:unnamed protein product, partial [Ceratitis capitata]
MTEQAQPLSITINPLKYLNQLPEFNGDYRDLQTFVNLIDRVHPLLTAYDLPSQLLFSDIIKGRLTGKARQVIEINCQAQSWTDIKNVLNNNFGDRCSLEELFDRLKSTTFKTNSVEFYNEIKQRLRNLNNKTVLSIGSGPAANECAKNNMKTALNIFKEKVPEPMRTILICRNPDSLETAMEILFQSGYAYVTSPNTTFSNHRTPNQEYKNLRTQKHNNRSYNNQNLARTNNRDTQKNLSYQQPNFHNHHRNNPNNPHNWQGNHKNSGHNGQPFQRQNNWNPFRQQEIPHTNNFPRPEPMDVNKFER